LFGPTVLIVHASTLAVALADDGPDGDLALARLRGEVLPAPALADLAALPPQRAPHLPLLFHCWEQRENLTAYDVADRRPTSGTGRRPANTIVVLGVLFDDREPRDRRGVG